MRRSTLPVLLLAGLFLIPAGLQAQRRTLQRLHRFIDRDAAVEIGIIGGPNRNTVTGAGPVDAKIRGSLGGFLSVPVIGSIRLRPEVLVSGKQVGFTDSFIPPCLPPGTQCVPITATEKASFTWLEAPLLIEARFPRAISRDVTPRIYGGPFIAVRLACSFSNPVADVPVPQGSSGPELVRPCSSADGSTTRYNNGDAGFVVGGTIAAGGVGIGVRWTRSLVPIAPDQSVAAGNRLIGAKNSTLAVTLEFATRIL
jgi:Outer membrane protein beta-barrel domain